MKPSNVSLIFALAAHVHATDTPDDRIATVMVAIGCIALWKLVEREPDGTHRFTAHIRKGTMTDFALGTANSIENSRGDGRATGV
jgi:hypothetical protein